MHSIALIVFDAEPVLDVVDLKSSNQEVGWQPTSLTPFYMGWVGEALCGDLAF